MNTVPWAFLVASIAFAAGSATIWIRADKPIGFDKRIDALATGMISALFLVAAAMSAMAVQMVT